LPGYRRARIYYLIWAFVLVAVFTTQNLLDSREGRAIRALKGGMVMAEAWASIPPARAS
jgi:branched-chain amino acid transport system permease protein